MSSNHEFEADLREMIRRREVVAIVGSGVSVAANPEAPGWRKLIVSAAERCRAIGAEDAWCEHVLGLLKLESYPDFLLSAAELVHSRLREAGELGRWLTDTFEHLAAADPSLILSLAELNVPLVTTNYDGLIEKVTGLNYMTWQDERKSSSFARGDRRVLHLHGHWDRPESVVLGIRSYESLTGSEHPQAVLRAMAMTKSLLFVGCGEEGLNDPNLGVFLKWLAALELKSGAGHRHYRLVLEKEKHAAPQGRLFPLVYGKKHSDLQAFLARLCPEPVPDSGGAQKARRSGLPAAAPESIRYYLSRLAGETAHLMLLGMGRSLQVELPIADAYVPLRTNMARSLEERGADRFKDGHAEFEENVELGEIFNKVRRLDQRGIVLLGEPGSGKTTGARQLAWRLASGQSRSEDLGLPAGMIPVLLRFRNLSSVALGKESGLRTFLEEETHCEEGPDVLKSPGADLWNGRGGPLLWILDGLDEVADSGARVRVAAWLRKAIEGRPHDWFVVTCRFTGYFRKGVPLGPKFVEFHVRPLDSAQVERFVREWFAAAYGKLLGQGDRAGSQARADSAELLDILARPSFQAGHINDLCTNPLLLTILCIVFHEERKLPTGRAELYGHCVRVLLDYWRRDRYALELGTSLEPYDAEAAQSVLARLAWWMHQQQDRTAAPLSELDQEAASGLSEVSPGSGLGADGIAFVQRMRDDGILAMEGEGRCGFLHLSFQEFLAADHAAREGLAAQLASRAQQSWWREVALLSLRRSRPFCESFFREMIEQGIPENNPDLAERCLEESLYFTPVPFVEALGRPRPETEGGGRAHDARVAAILRLLRDRAGQTPELLELSGRLAESSDPETRGFAREILSLSGVELKPTVLDPRVPIIDEQSGMTFVAIPAGEFDMGSDNGESDEKPVHRVRISRGFWLGKYPVTNAQYGRFLQAGVASVRKPEEWDNPRFNRPEQPVVGVSWDEARAFCEWAGGRLPTEAEWEYACRAGTAAEYGFGDSPEKLDEYGWFAGNSGGQTQPVGAKKPNLWGLHDMHGNVFEWCEDWFDPSYDGSRPDVDPAGPKTGDLRVFRGGSWNFPPQNCRSAFRNRFTPSFRFGFLGFRVARSSAEQAGRRAEPGTEVDGTKAESARRTGVPGGAAV